MQRNFSQQTDSNLNSEETHQIIANVYTESPSLPLIEITFKTQTPTFLLDSGSSLSIISNDLFEKLKHNNKYKNIARKVSVKTINSKVSFTACIEMSFKIAHKFFKHSFFVTNFKPNSIFQGILGYDFMLMHEVGLKLKDNTLTIKGDTIPLLGDRKINNDDEYTYINELETSTNQDCLSDMSLNNKIAKDKHNVDHDIYAKLKDKITLEQNQHAFAEIIIENCPNENILFEPCIDIPNIECHPSIHDFKNFHHNTTKKTFKNQSNVSQCIFIKNNSNQAVHLNKGQKIGTVTPISEIQTLNSNNDSENNLTSEFLNLIIPDDDIIKQRKAELAPSDFDLTHLTPEQQNILSDFLMENFRVFSKSLKTLGHTDRVVPKLSLIHKYPIRTLPFPVPQALQAEALQQIIELQEAGLIERSATEWACPMLLVKKKTNPKQKTKYRLALDLRLLNRIVQCSAYPLPKISTIISNLSNYKYFTVLDLPNAYWQIDLPKDLQDIIAFTTPFGSFKCKRLPFGLKTASSKFQELIDSIIDETNTDGYFAYQDDVIVAAQSFEEMVKKLKILFSLLSKYNITLSPNKCQFFLNEINYLGFNICQHKIQPIQSNIIKITSFPIPKTKRQLKKFIGVCNYYRNLLPAYASKIQPLIDLTTPKAKFKWQEKHQNIFDQLQKIFFNHPFVRLPQWDKEFILNTDGSQLAISGVLLQEFDGELCPVSYFSKSLKSAEKKYPAIKIELMAIVKSILAFKHYLYGRHFTVLSDSKPLKKYKQSTSPADITTRWLMEISEYSFTFKHIPGKSNVLADYFSRLEEEPPQQNLSTNPDLINNDKEILPIVENYYYTNENVLNAIQNNDHDSNNITLNPNSDTFLEISEQSFLTEQKLDKHIRQIFNKVKNKQFNRSNMNYFIDSKTKLLMYVYHEYAQNVPVIVVPDSLKAKVIAIAHISHFGIKKTYKFLRRKYFWFGMYSDTENYVKSCEKCITVKHHTLPHAPLQNSEIVKRPSEIISLDFVGPFKNQQYILTIMDHFSRHMELFPLSTISANNVTDCLFSYIAIHGRASTVLSDQGTQFCSEVFEKLAKTLGIRINHSSVSHPESNSVSERINSGIKSTVNSLMQEGQTFTNAIRIHKNLYNGSVHSSTGFPPNVLHFGRPLSLIFDTFNPNIEVEQLDKGQYIESLLSDLNKNYEKCYNNLIETQQKQNLTKNEKSKLREFKPEDIVYIKSRDKFNKKFSGPYKVLTRNTKVNYSIQLLHNPKGRVFTIHVDRLLLSPPRKHYLVNENNSVAIPQSGNVPRYNLRTRNIH